MRDSVSSNNSVRLHLTNVIGAGATQLLQSLLPALECDAKYFIERIELPERGELATYRSGCTKTTTEKYNRFLPNSLSRILECTWLANQFDGDSPLLVLGDLPLRCRGAQTVFVHQSNLLYPKKFLWRFDYIKYALSRLIFRLSMARIHAFIVQTDTMRSALEQSYPEIIGRVHVVAQPVPIWLLHSGIKRNERVGYVGEGLNLIYPAAGYPHKNHALLSHFNASTNTLIERLTLTLEPSDNPAPQLPFIFCSGFLLSQEMIEAYSNVDALLFLSKKESYGFPLVEAMFVGLPIVCPDLPYAHELCGDQAIYFDSDQPESLNQALCTLQSRLDLGWWPDWKERLRSIPASWEEVARSILEITCSSHQE
ncbi:hypothetical protein ACH42_00295 [Endozoicomonas sp. (ex Bugula neritina AB1)]|nr:hypothetical protein ACH42_00295 [Endozoicomonas sp. (ex Bugula neritina AB1)]